MKKGERIQALRVGLPARNKIFFKPRKRQSWRSLATFDESGQGGRQTSSHHEEEGRPILGK